VADNFELILLCFLQLVIFIAHESTDISTKQHFLLTVALCEELLNRDCGLVIKMSD
jgi:hypothetical protein